MSQQNNTEPVAATPAALTTDQILRTNFNEADAKAILKRFAQIQNEQGEEISLTLLRHLAAHPNDGVRALVAVQPSLTALHESVPHFLAKDRNVEVCKALACHPDLAQFPKAVLILMVKDSALEVRRALVTRPDLAKFPTDVLMGLAGNQPFEIRKAFAERSDLDKFPEAILMQLARDVTPVRIDNEKNIRETLAGHPALSKFSEKVLMFLAKGEQPEVHRAFVTHTHLAEFPEAILMHMVMQYDEDLRRVLVTHRDLAKLPKAVLMRLAVDRDLKVRRALVTHPDLAKFPTDVIMQFAEKDTDEVRKAFAERPDLEKFSQKVLLKLLLENNGLGIFETVRAFVNFKALPEKDLNHLILGEDTDPRILEVIAKDPYLPELFPRTAKFLISPQGWQINSALAKNPSLARMPEIFIELVNVTPERTHCILAKHPDLGKVPEAIAALLKISKEENLRSSIIVRKAEFEAAGHTAAVAAIDAHVEPYNNMLRQLGVLGAAPEPAEISLS